MTRNVLIDETFFSSEFTVLHEYSNARVVGFLPVLLGSQRLLASNERPVEFSLSNG